MENDSKADTLSSSLKIDKDDIRAKRHYLKTSVKDGKEVKIWECGLCAKEFKFQYTLVRHIPTHTDVRNYQCNMCPKAFRQLSTLAQHKVTHLNLRPFVCEYCCKSFNRISTLISHKKIHYDIKRHICSFCGKGFHQKGNLRNHMYTHTNERPYKCDVCLKGFNQKSNLVCHKLSTHLKKIYQCGICKLQFTKEVFYTSHMSGIHNIMVCKSETMVNSSSIQPETDSREADGNRKSNYILSLPVVYSNACNNNNEGEYPLSGTASFKLDMRSGLFRKGSECPTITPIPNFNNGIKVSQFGLMSSPMSLGNLSNELKKQMAVVYTKTQPNVRALKPRVNVPSHENTLDDSCLLHAKCLECSSRALTVDGAAFLSSSKTPPSPILESRGRILFFHYFLRLGNYSYIVFSLPSGSSNLPTIPTFSISSSSEPFTPPIPSENDGNVRIIRKCAVDTTNLSSKTIQVKTVSLDKPISGLEDLAKVHEDPTNNNVSSLFEIKTELPNEVLSHAPIADVVNDMEPSLFSGADALKDTFKFGLDFESNFDFLEEAFGSGLLDNVNMTSTAAEGFSNPYCQGKFDEGLSFIDL